MAQLSENLDFSGLFKLDVLIHLDIVSYSFYELGLKKFLAFSSNKELLFFYINRESERLEKNLDWDFLDNPIFCMCFEPSGTWVLIISEQKILLVPFLPQFTPQNTFDCKWSLSGVTVLPLANIPKPTTVVWWLTKESENIIIIGSKIGIVTFYSLESQCVVGECKVSSEIKDLQICFDDSLDLLALLISGGKSQQWKLVLEHRSYGYNWLQQSRAQADKRDGFMSYIKQLSKDKITLFGQGGSKDDGKSQPIEYVLKPTEYLPSFRKGSNNWALSAQYVNGRHFLTAFELNEGTLILESPEEETPSRTLRPCIKKDGQYVLGLWSQRLIFLLRKNELEVHSANFSVVQGEALLGTKRDFTELWAAELIGSVRGAHIMSAREPTNATGGWREPTFMCDLQLPRFAVDGCLVVTTSGAYILNTVSEPCEWLVGVIMRGGGGAEQRAAALGAPVPTLLRASADMLLSRGKIAPAQYLFSLSQSQPDGWVARLGVFGRLHELSMYKHAGHGSLGAPAVAIKMLALLLKMGTNEEETFDMDAKFTTLSKLELTELTSIAAAIGMWQLVPVFSTHCGYPALILTALKSRRDICRSAITCLLQQLYVVPLLLEENAQWLFDFITEKCDSFDTKILKCFCLWLNPMQEQLRPVMRDLNQGISSIYTTRMLQLISTFMRVACALEARSPCPDLHLEVTQTSDTWKNQFVPRRTLSCGLGHWAVTDEGNAKVLMTDTPVNTEVIGRVLDVACGRHHTLVLTENGIYAAGDNSYGQLGVGAAWAGAAGDAAAARGALLRVRPGGAAVAAGHYHSAAVDQGGRLYTWGWGVHGQLGLGSIDDKWTPQLVTKFQGRKVLRVGCGACHTVVLTRSGEAWAMGAGVFGQLGNSRRDKSSLPQRVALLDQPVLDIAVGYFHTLALTQKQELWCWGASPQQVRAAAARRDATSPTPVTPVTPARDSHLVPARVDTGRVASPITQGRHGESGEPHHTGRHRSRRRDPPDPRDRHGESGEPHHTGRHRSRRRDPPDPCDPRPRPASGARQGRHGESGEPHHTGRHRSRRRDPPDPRDPVTPAHDPHLVPARVDTGRVASPITQVDTEAGDAIRPTPVIDTGRVASPITQVDTEAGDATRPTPVTLARDPHLVPARVDTGRVASPITQVDTEAGDATRPTPVTPVTLARDPHLVPARVDTGRVASPITQIAAGWHHSCIIDSAGTLYSWGLNFDGQLGSGDRKQIAVPTEVRFRTDSHPHPDVAKPPATPSDEAASRALVACGGDFTVYIDDDGRVYATGNMHAQTNNEKDKGTNRVIMMKTTKRVIKIPASRSNNKFLFQPIDRIDIMFPFDVEGSRRKPLETRLNPLTCCKDFRNKSWPDNTILLLREYINEDVLATNLNMAAKLAYHNKKYSDCLKLLLDNLKSSPQEDCLYLTHSELEAHEKNGSAKYPRKEDELKIIITNVMSKRIKDVSLTILNEEPYPVIDSEVYQTLPCCCDEIKYLPKKPVATSTLISESDLSVKAANVIDRCISIFPVDTKLWEVCFRLSKDFYLENNLSVAELEGVLRKYMESNATTMAGAIMYSNDCAQYSKILSPKFYLNMCSEVLDTWG